MDNFYLHQELEKLKRMIFGVKSERFTLSGPSQLSMDLGLETLPPVEPQTEDITYTRKKTGKDNGHARMQISPSIPREIVVIEPAEDVSDGRKIGEKVTEVLDYTPGKLKVTRYVRPVYALPEEQGVVIGNLPSLPITRGNAGAGLLAHLTISKFVDHLPFYRQVQMFKRQGVTLAESTVNDWFRASCDLLEPLYECLKKTLLQGNYLMADETPIAVQTENKPGATHKGYHWVYYSPVERLVLFDYRKGRGREGPEELLKDYRGALQADGYSAYESFEKKPGITLLACMAHARRKFDESLKNDKTRAEHALTLIQQLYAIERQAREERMDYDQRKTLRLEKSAPILEELHGWLKENITQTLPKSAIGIAIAYTLHLWPRLLRYLDDGRYEIDNNLIENSIRPVALGRKNYLFAGSHEGAKRAAMMYSFLGTCKINNVEPFEWLSTVLKHIPDHSIQCLEELLPGNLK
ncbi:MAG: IS66 family transposase [Bacteroidales bacterium]|nr:IS66 family transposase [Bacteroidales bacterium]